MDNIKEKISAMYDGELNSSEIDELIEIVNNNKDMQKQLSLYSLINVAVNQGSSKLKQKIVNKDSFKKFLSNVWLLMALLLQQQSY